MKNLKAFAAIAPGLERVLHAELAEIGVSGTVEPGGVAFEATSKNLALVHRNSRLAGRVTVELGGAKAKSLEQLSSGARAMPWKDFVVPGQPIEVKIITEGIQHRFAASFSKKLELAITDALRGPRLPGPRPPREPFRVQCVIQDDKAKLRIDASGDLLHRRGWRLATAKAPLRENLAAAVLLAVGWTPDEPLVDPMCGSGTFAIEAAGLALGHAPGARGKFGFLTWPSFDKRVWIALDKHPVARGQAPIVAADRDVGAIRATTENAQRAQVTRRIAIVESDVRDLQAPADHGLVVANPPWGARIERKEPAWKALGDAMRGNFAGWGLAVLSPDRSLLADLGMQLEPVLTFPSGGTRITLYASER